MFTSTRTTLGNTQPKYSSASAVANARQKQHNKAFANQTNQFNDIEKKFIIFTQTLNFENIKVKDIETLQQLLKPLLDTIILSNDPNSSINKPHNLYYEGKTNKKSDKPDVISDDSTNYNIFRIPAGRKNLDKNKYGKFLKFMITESIIINKNFSNANITLPNSNSDVEILTEHSMYPETDQIK